MQTSRQPRVLFITSSRIGDAVLSTGVLEYVRGQRPGARVTITCGALSAPLFADLPGLETIIPIVRQTGQRIGHWTSLWRQVNGQRWSDVIDLRSPFFSYFLRADHRWICRAEKRHEHRIEELARQLGLSNLPAPQLYVSPERQNRVLAEIGGTRPLLAIGPTANWGGKQWPAERFAETARQLTASDGILPGARVVVLGASHEREAAQPVLAACQDGLDWVGRDDLLDVFTLLRHCAFYLGNDSGLMHLAAAANIPTLGLFGPSAEWRYRPWGELGAVVRTPETLAELTGTPDYDYRSQRSLMLGLTVEAVAAAAEALWKRSNG